MINSKAPSEAEPASFQTCLAHTPNPARYDGYFCNCQILQKAYKNPLFAIIMGLNSVTNFINICIKNIY